MRLFRRLALTTLVLALGAALAEAQSLAEVAKKEKERRDKNQSDAKRVITDRELARSFGSLPASSTNASETEGSAEGSETEDPGQPTDETRTQEYWQNRVKATQTKIATLEQQLNSNDWGEGQRVGVDPRGQNNLAGRQQVEQQLAAAREELEAIRSEARRAGVPPGWVR